MCVLGMDYKKIYLLCVSFVYTHIYENIYLQHFRATRRTLPLSGVYASAAYFHSPVPSFRKNKVGRLFG